MQRGSVPSVQSGALHTFSRAPQVMTPRSKFDRSHGVKTTFNEGYIIPILAEEMLPGDTFSVQLHAFARMATPFYPIMDNLYMETFFFFIPNRLVWTNWQAFYGEVDPDQSSPTTVPTWDTYSVPQVTASAGVATGDPADYMGIPIGVNGITFNALHLRAMNKVFNDWFRDENLQESVYLPLDNGPDTYSNYVLLRRGKRYDYFTSCLPWPQKGPAVTLPLGSFAPVESTGVANIQLFDGASSYNLQGTGTPAIGASGSFSSSANLSWGNPTGLQADLASATSATIESIREAFQMQKFYERAARGGTRYTELVKSFFGVVSPDMRLQRSEYLGGGSTPVVINPVAQTAQATSPTNTDALGNLGAYGVCNIQGHGFNYSATEHGVVLGFVSVRADINYQQGLERMWSRQTIWDFYLPPLAHLGEQEVLNQEIYAQGSSADTEVFGYQERYAEYRYKPSQITGLFRSSASGTLDAWHLAQNFGSLPTLNYEFIQEAAPMGRVEVVADQPDFIFDGFFKMHCVRPMPTYAVPGFIDHF